jgi:hypothetical protein
MIIGIIAIIVWGICCYLIGWQLSRKENKRNENFPRTIHFISGGSTNVTQQVADEISDSIRIHGMNGFTSFASAAEQGVIFVVNRGQIKYID